MLNSSSTATGSTANVGKGVYFVRGYFVPVQEQTLVLDQYSNNPSYKVGLKVEERIITADEDATLYDNAIGSTNFSAPGADRFKINLTLVKKETTAPNAADFIELLRTNTGRVQKKVERSTLGFINDVLATRTKEESGDYYVKNSLLMLERTLMMDLTTVYMHLMLLLVMVILHLKKILQFSCLQEQHIFQDIEQRGYLQHIRMLTNQELLIQH